MHNAVIIDTKDNVAVAIEEIKKGEEISYSSNGKTFHFPALQDIAIYHKTACFDIRKGEPICKYGEHIGIAARDISRGEHVHTHNVLSRRENLD